MGLVPEVRFAVRVVGAGEVCLPEAVGGRLEFEPLRFGARMGWGWPGRDFGGGCLEWVGRDLEGGLKVLLRG